MDKLYEQALNTKTLYRRGLISREEAKEQIKPYEDYYNGKVVEIAKKYNRKPVKFSFASFMR
jgi:hypothetical protein